MSKAEIIFFDTNERVLKTVIVNERGPGQLVIYASNLSNGIYSYSLVVDGKTIDTKKTVKQN